MDSTTVVVEVTPPRPRADGTSGCGGSPVSSQRRTEETLDPVTFELVYAGLVSAAEEMGGVLKRSSHSPIIREMDDFSCALFAANGDLVAQADFIPAQLGAMSLVVGSVIQRWGERDPPRRRLHREPPVHGRDAYAGRQHPAAGLPQRSTFRVEWRDGPPPRRRRREPRDRGTGPTRGVRRGGHPAARAAVSARGRRTADLFDLLTENVRDPASTVSDLRAQRAACVLGERRLEELVERFGERTDRDRVRPGS